MSEEPYDWEKTLKTDSTDSIGLGHQYDSLKDKNKESQKPPRDNSRLAKLISNSSL